MNHKSLVLFVIFAMISFNLSACVCFKPTFQEAVDQADEVFIGEVIRAEKYIIGKRNWTNGTKKNIWGWVYQIEVEKKWKGNDKSIFIFYSGGSSCSSHFSLYRKYLIYAKRKSLGKKVLGLGFKLPDGIEQLNTNICTRNTSKRADIKENWYNEDCRNLNEQFPTEIELLGTEIAKRAANEIELEEKEISNFWLIIMGFLILTLGLVFKK